MSDPNRRDKKREGSSSRLPDPKDPNKKDEGPKKQGGQGGDEETMGKEV